MKLSEYVTSLSEAEQDSYAEACGTTGKYLRAHILYARKECRKALREKLAAKSCGKVSLTEVLQHFGIIPESVPANAATSDEAA